MNQISDLDKFTKFILISGLIILFYGFISRLIPIYFFWESKLIAWWILSFGSIRLLIHGIKKRKNRRNKMIFNKILIGFFCFVLLIQVCLMIAIPNTEAFQISKDYIKNNENIKKEVGEIESLRHIPTGGISYKNDSNGEKARTNIDFIVKGNKSFKTLTVFVFKDYGQEWKVEGIRDLNKW